jgi:hypothetical protein
LMGMRRGKWRNTSNPLPSEISRDRRNRRLPEPSRWPASKSCASLTPYRYERGEFNPEAQNVRRISFRNAKPPCHAAGATADARVANPARRVARVLRRTARGRFATAQRVLLRSSSTRLGLF